MQMAELDCLFCKIVAGELPSHKVWEDENHLAFLTIFPNIPGFTVVATKEHYPSYIFDQPTAVASGIFNAAGKVAQLLDNRFSDVGRCGLMFEGFGVDHLHAKLFPMHGTKLTEWKQIASDVDKVFSKYEGYISSHNGPRADDSELAKLAAFLRGEREDY